MFKIYIIDVTFLPVTCLIHSARSQDKEKILMQLGKPACTQRSIISVLV